MFAPRLRSGSAICVAIVSIGAGLALTGWLLRLRLLTEIGGGTHAMKPNAMVSALLACGAILAYSHSRPGSRLRWAGAAAAAAVLVIAVATLSEYALGWRLGIDELLFRDWGTSRAPYPGRPAANASVGFALVSGALLLWDARVRRLWVSHLLAWLAATVGLLAVAGYATGATALISLTSRQQIALGGAIGFVLMPVAILLACPERGEMALLAGDGQGGVLLRRLLPAAVAVPVGLATATLIAEKIGLFSTAFGAWLSASTGTVALMAMAWSVASAAERAGRQRARIEGMMQAVADSAADAIVTIDRAGTITYVNPALERMFGYAARELVGHAATILAAEPHPSDGVIGPAQPRRNDRGSPDTDDAPPSVSELTGRRSDGREFPIEVSRGVWEDRGELVVTGVIRDVSARRRAERKLLGLLQSAPDAIVVIDASGEIVVANARVQAVFGYAPDEIVGQPIEMLVPHRHRAAHIAERRRYLRDPRPERIRSDLERYGRRADGTEFPVEVTLNPIETDDGLLIAGAIRDISERRRADEASARLAAIVDSSPDAIIGLTVEGMIETWNAGAERLYGYTAREVVGWPIAILSAAETLHHRRHVEAALAGATVRFESRDLRRDGSRVETRVAVSPIRNAAGTITGVSCLAHDISAQTRASREREQALEDLRLSEQRLRTLFEAAPIGVALVNADEPWRLLQVNGALSDMIGIDVRGLLRRDALRLVDESERPVVGRHLRRLRDGTTRQFSLEARTGGDGDAQRWVSLHGAAVRRGDGTAEHLVLQVEDITSRKRYEQELRTHAERDPLTGLLNRRRLDEELHRAVAESSRHGTPATLLVCDLDNFKLVNDTLGHTAGDEVIQRVAHALRLSARDSDILARLGGDEFAVLLPQTTVESARAVADRLRAAVCEIKLPSHDHRWPPTLSVGIAPLGSGITAEESLVAADLAMYDAKRHGRNRVAASRRARDGADEPDADALERLRSALDDDRFELHAQPITDLRNGEVRLLELLLRLRTEDGTLLPPAEFIPIAERHGLIAEVDRWVVRAAIRILAAAPQATTTYTINLSGLSVGDPELLALIEREIVRRGVDPRRLVFEFTETAAISDLVASGEFTRQLARIGCASALDDFGSGFGSFSYLKHLPVDYLKIDREFVQHLPGSGDDRVLVKAIIDMAHGLHKQTIAEFVESEAACAMLRDYGVDYAQGEYLGMPALAPTG